MSVNNKKKYYVVFLVGALHCYQCDSKTNPDCKEYFDHGNIDQLSVKPTECGVDAAEYCVKTSGAWGGRQNAF